MIGGESPTHEEPSNLQDRWEKHPRWKGGVTTSQGYRYIKVPERAHLKGLSAYVREHRLVMEKILGRRLKRGEVVHHINGDTLDNRPENLELLPSQAWHMHLGHRVKTETRAPGEPNVKIGCACGCGGSLWKYDKHGRSRRYLRGHSKGNLGKFWDRKRA